MLVHTKLKVAFLEKAKGYFGANLCWYRYGGIRANKHVLVHTKFKVVFLEKAKGDYSKSLFLRRQKDILERTCAGTGTVAPGPANLCWCIQN